MINKDGGGGGGGQFRLAIKFRDCTSVFLVHMIPLVPLVWVELHSLGLGISVSPLVALVSIELHS